MSLRTIHGMILGLAGCLALAGPIWASIGADAVDAVQVADTPAAVKSNADIIGRWRLTKVLDTTDIASMSDRQARADRQNRRGC